MTICHPKNERYRFIPMSEIALGFYQFNLLVKWLLAGLLLISIPAALE
jgi:hypothetical protein